MIPTSRFDKLREQGRWLWPIECSFGETNFKKQDNSENTESSLKCTDILLSVSLWLVCIIPLSLKKL